MLYKNIKVTNQTHAKPQLEARIAFYCGESLPFMFDCRGGVISKLLISIEFGCVGLGRLEHTHTPVAPNQVACLGAQLALMARQDRMECIVPV